MKKTIKPVLYCILLGLFLLVPGKISAKTASTADTFYLYQDTYAAYHNQTTLAVTENIEDKSSSFDMVLPEMENVKTIILSNKVNNIPPSLCKKCPNVTKIQIGKDVDVIPFLYNLVDFKKLTTITVAAGNSDLKVKNNVLYTYDMESIVAYPYAKKDSSYTMPSAVKGDFSALGANPYLKQVIIGKSFSTISSFQSDKRCLPNLTEVKVASSNKKLKAKDGIVYTYNMKTAIYYPNGKKASSYTVPSTVTKVGNCFGSNKYLKKITLGKNVASFTRPNDTKVIVLPKLASIKTAAGNKHFSAYDGALYTYGYKSLLYCVQGKKTSYKVHPNTRIIRAKAFAKCNISKITLPKGLVEIQPAAFTATPVTSIVIPSTVKDLDKFTSGMSSLKTITVQSGSKYFFAKEGILYHKNGTIAAWPAKRIVKSLAFTSDLTKSIVLSDFKNAKYLENLSIGKNVSYIDVGNQSLKQIVLNSKNKSYHLYDGVLYNKDYSRIVVYPNKNPDTAIELYKDLKVLKQKWFYGTNNTKELILPAGLTNLYTHYSTTSENMYASAGRESEHELLHDYTYGPAFVKSSFQNLEKLSISDDNAYFTCVDNVLYRKDMKILFWYPVARTDTEYTMPEAVVKLSAQLRELKNLKTLTINNKVKSTLNFLGIYSSSLESIIVPEDNPDYVSVDGILYSKNMEKLVVYPNGKQDSSYTMPDTVKTARFALSNRYLSTLNLSSSMETIVRYSDITDSFIVKHMSVGGFFGFDKLEELNGCKEDLRFQFDYLG